MIKPAWQSENEVCYCEGIWKDYTSEKNKIK